MTTAELRATVERMEARLSADPRPDVRALMTSYAGLKLRFARDLPEERELLLSCGGALMLIQETTRRDARADASASDQS